MRAAEEGKLTELTEEIFDWFFRIHPTSGTFVGMHSYDDHLEDMSVEQLEENLEKCKDYQYRLLAVDESALSKEKEVDYRLLESMLADMVREHEKLETHKKNPIVYLNPAVESIYLLLIRDSYPLEDRLRNGLERMRQVPALLEAAKRQLKHPPAVFLETTLLHIQGAWNFYCQTIPEIAEEVPDLKKELVSEAENVCSALKEFKEFIQGLTETAAGNFAVGEEVFNELLRERHFMGYDTENLLYKGQELVAHTHRELESLAQEIDPSQDWREIVKDTKKEHPDADDLIEYYRRELDRVKQFVIDHDIVEFPEQEDLIVEETPMHFRPLIPYAAYLPPGAFSQDQLGRFWVTPVAPGLSKSEQEAMLGEHSKYSIPIKVLHEAYPGHHLQLCHSNYAQSKVKKLYQSTLFAEGWAFYCEELLEELGYISDPKVKLHRLKDQAWRAARIVLDVSLHTGKMNFNEAVDYLVSNAMLEKESARAEVRRYAQTPTQPMSYLMGKQEIMKIVNGYWEKHGASATLKEFHRELLSHGTIPPALVKELVLDEEAAL